MTKEDMWAVVRRHMDAEYAGDIAGSLATMVPDAPYYILHPIGFRITGQVAIAEMYKRLFASIFPNVIESESLTMGTGGSGDEVWYADNSLMIKEWARVRMPSGDGCEITEFALFEFEGDLIKGETIYCNGPLGKLMADALGGEFPSITGVSRIY